MKSILEVSCLKCGRKDRLSLNKIYKIIWSRTKNCYVVASELAKGHTKAKSSSIVRKVSLSMAVAAMLASTYGAPGVLAVESTKTFVTGMNNDQSSNIYGYFVGTGSETTNGLALGGGYGTAHVYGNANAVALGAATWAYGKSSVAIGGGRAGLIDSLNGAEPTAEALRKPSYGVGQVAIGWNFTQGEAAVAIGGDRSRAFGKQTVAIANGEARADNATALNGAIASGANSFASGGGNASKTDTIAMGLSTVASANNALAFGRGAQATTANSVALGNGATTASTVGTASYKIGSKTVNFAGSKPTGTVSVGAPNNERTITNVAAGRISQTSTDAINGSQLYQALQNVSASGGSTDPMTFAGDKGTNITRNLGDTLNIKGNAPRTATLVEGNIGVESNGTDTLTVKLNKDINLGNTGSVAIGNTTINNNGFTNGSTSMSSTGVTTPSLTIPKNGGQRGIYLNDTGLNMDGKPITNVANGTRSNSAATVGQLPKVEAGINTTVTSTASTATAPITYTVKAVNTAYIYCKCS